MHRFYIIAALSLALTSCTGNLLTYKHRIYFHEENELVHDSIFLLRQRVCYNRPQVIDEEHCYELQLTFTDTLAAKTKKLLDLATDTALVKASYGLFSVWSWGGDDNPVSGTIQILRWRKDCVVLRERVYVYDRYKQEKKSFRGTRTFRKKK